MLLPTLEELKIGIIGLGYVGAPLAVAFGEKYDVVGYDVDQSRVTALGIENDATGEIKPNDWSSVASIKFTADKKLLSDRNCFIVTVPTPVDAYNRPDLTFLKKASELVGEFISDGNIVIFESTVYPGATEEFCGPLICEVSGLSLHDCDEPGESKGFYLGYSPERVNPGDGSRRLKDIIKVTAASTPESSIFVNNLYASIISAGTHAAESIKVAEAAKVIENTQRDVNIALINELTQLFNLLEIDTQQVLEAASTKWNFLDFKPGLVGGHCIGVDPYYITHKALEVGHHPEMILAGRRQNESMSAFVASRLLKLMLDSEIKITGAKVLLLGVTFKENCPDMRNSKVFDVIDELEAFGCLVEKFDPVVSRNETSIPHSVGLLEQVEPGRYDVIVLAVGHDEFTEMGSREIRKFGKPNHILFDVKYIFPKDEVDGRL